MGGGNGEGGGNGDGGGEGTRDIIMLILCPKRRKWWSRQTNFEDFSKDCSKKISKDFNFAVRSGTRKRTQRDTLRAARNTQIQYTHE